MIDTPVPSCYIRNMKWTESETALLAELLLQLGAQGRAVAAIDGNAAAGKSTLAARIAAFFAPQYSVNVFHMDDFFLPGALRTAERLAEPGGNVHYERFQDEVLAGVASGAPFSYGVFDCGRMAVTRRVAVEPAALTLVEGAYSMHPRFGTPYSLRVFLRATPETQRARILARNGAAMLARFESIWIPMENAYFSAFRIPEQCDFVLHAEDMNEIPI